MIYSELIKEIMQQILVGCLTYPKHTKKVIGRGPLGDRDPLFLYFSFFKDLAFSCHFPLLPALGAKVFSLKITVSLI